MPEFVVERDCGPSRSFDSRSDAEEAKELHDNGSCACKDDATITIDGEEPSPETDEMEDVEIVKTGSDGTQGEPASDGGEVVDADQLQDSVTAIQQVKEGGLDTDPLSVLPGFMVDSIQGTQAVNKRGYAMIAERYGIETTSQMVESPWENNEGRVVMEATAKTQDGSVYNAFGTACADDGDDEENLIELADTRSKKRAVQWASGFGIVGYQELTGQLEEQ